MKKENIIAILLLACVILSFVVPIKTEEEWITIEDPNPPGFFGAGAVISEKYKIYYNIYGLGIIRLATGEKKTSPQ